MAVTYVGKGTFTPGQAALTVPQPASTVAGDLLLLVCESANELVATPITPTGWTILSGSPQGIGTAGAAGATCLSVFYKFHTGSEASVSVADSGNHTCAQIFAFRGVNRAAANFITAGGTLTAGTARTLTGVTTAAADSCIVWMIATDTDLASTANFTGFTNANLTSITEQHDESVATQQGGGLAVYTSFKVAAGATGNSTVTQGTSVTSAFITLALAPQVSHALAAAATCVSTASVPGFQGAALAGSIACVCSVGSAGGVTGRLGGLTNDSSTWKRTFSLLGRMVMPDGTTNMQSYGDPMGSATNDSESNPRLLDQSFTATSTKAFGLFSSGAGSTTNYLVSTDASTWTTDGGAFPISTATQWQAIGKLGTRLFVAAGGIISTCASHGTSWSDYIATGGSAPLAFFDFGSLGVYLRDNGVFYTTTDGSTAGSWTAGGTIPAGSQAFAATRIVKVSSTYYIYVPDTAIGGAKVKFYSTTDFTTLTALGQVDIGISQGPIGFEYFDSKFITAIAGSSGLVVHTSSNCSTWTATNITSSVYTPSAPGSTRFNAMYSDGTGVYAKIAASSDARIVQLYGIATPLTEVDAGNNFTATTIACVSAVVGAALTTGIQLGGSIAVVSTVVTATLITSIKFAADIATLSTALSASLTTAIRLNAVVIAQVATKANLTTVKRRGGNTANNGNGTSTLSLLIPINTRGGDVLTVALTVAGGSGVTISGVPAGWALLNRTDNGILLTQAVYWKVATGVSSSLSPEANTSPSWTFTNNKASGSLDAWYDAKPGAPYLVVAQANASSTSITAPSATTTFDFSSAVWVFGTNAATSQSSVPGTFSQQDSSNGSSSTTTITSYANQPITNTVIPSQSAVVGTAAANVGQLLLLQTENPFIGAVGNAQSAATGTLSVAIRLASSITVESTASGTLPPSTTVDLTTASAVDITGTTATIQAFFVR